MGRNHNEFYDEAYPKFWEAIFMDHCQYAETDEQTTRLDSVRSDLESDIWLEGPADEVLRSAERDATYSVEELLFGIDLRAAVSGAVLDSWRASCGDTRVNPSRVIEASKAFGIPEGMIDESVRNAYCQGDDEV